MMQTNSYEAQIIARAKAARAACYGRPRIVNLAVDKPEPKPEPVISGPMSFIKAKCAEHGLTYEEMTAKNQHDRSVETRNAIIKATAAEYPDMLVSRLARLFKRNHSTILYALGRSQKKKASMAAINRRDARAKVLYMQNMPLKDIATELNVSINTVKKIRERRKWKLRARLKPKGQGEG